MARRTAADRLFGAVTTIGAGGDCERSKTGAPQLGHAAAWLEICLPHSPTVHRCHTSSFLLNNKEFKGSVSDPVNRLFIFRVRLQHGFVYLIAIMDWYSRFVLAWQISTTLDTTFCVSALDHALALSKPGIFNTDQGSQFTSLEFTGRLENCHIQISMDGRGRVYDNIFVERLWRSVKYEEVYLHDYETVLDARNGIGRYLLFYDTERLHESLGYKTPYEIYVKKRLNFNPVQASIVHLNKPYFLS